MFLKKLIFALLIINLGYFAYSQAWFQTLIADGDASQRESKRITQQINPDAIVVKSASAQTTEPNSCLQEREQWIVYMGPYATVVLQENKKAELKKMAVPNKAVSKTSLPIGLSLGQFDTEAAAHDALQRLRQRGVKTATVILWETTSCS